ncbi:DNA N-6-adenine-methyltransferase [Vibrio phage LP.1]|nr:DNA N-6-adenine-methyltransferase [Vibrio phage LP.1]
MAHLVKSQTELSEKNRWGTTWECFQDAVDLFGASLEIDVCAEPQTAKCARYLISPDWKLDKQALRESYSACVGFDALQCWWGDRFWCNPPFDLKQAFIERAVLHANNGCSGMMLIPYEPCTQWFRKLVVPFASVIYVPDGRYNFLHTDGETKKSGVNFPSCFVLFTPHHNGGEAKIVNFERGLSND